MQALSIRLARRLNALAGRSGSVFVDRYHAHALSTRREVANAVRYVLGNYRHHARENLPRGFVDPLFYVPGGRPGHAQLLPRTWLLRVGWKPEPASRRPRGFEPQRRIR